MKSRISSRVSRDENGEKVGAGFAGQRVDPGVSVTQSALAGNGGTSSHFKPLDLDLGSTPQRHTNGLRYLLFAFRKRLEEVERDLSMLVETSKRAHVANPAAAQLPKSPKTQAFEGVVMYYGYRFYDPETGRWPSRDPIGERGGVNLYGFVRNDGVNGLDYLGMAVIADDGDLTSTNFTCEKKCDEELLFWNNAEGADMWRFTSPDGKGFNPWNRAGAQWFAKKRDNTTAMPATSLDDVIQTIKFMLTLNPDCDCYSRITLAGHGYNISNAEGVLLEKGVAFFGSEPVTMNDKVFLRNSHDKLAEIAKYICPKGVLEIMGCNTMGDQGRIAEMQKLANNIQRKVQGYTGPFEFDILNNLGDQTSEVIDMLNEPGSLTLSPE